MEENLLSGKPDLKKEIGWTERDPDEKDREDVATKQGAINHITALLNEMVFDFQETPQGQGLVLIKVTPGE
jgi:hypothetical protein